MEPGWRHYLYNLGTPRERSSLDRERVGYKSDGENEPANVSEASDAMKPIWNWLKDDKNRDILKMTAASLGAVVAATWAVLTFVVDHHQSTSVTSGAGGMAAGHDISGNTIMLAPSAGKAPPATMPAAKPP